MLRIRGEYPTVAGSAHMIPTRCALTAAWYTPILSERKAQRVLDRMKQRLVPIIEDEARRAEFPEYREEYQADASRVRTVGLTVADKVPCQRGSSGCYSPRDNRIFLRRRLFGQPQREMLPFDPFTHATHGSLLHELAHAAARGRPRMGRSHVVGPVLPGVPLQFRRRLWRDVHGDRFIERLAQAAKVWCESEGKSVCNYYCAGRR